MLVRALANIALCYVPGEGAWFTTMERGHYGDSAGQGDEALAEAVVQRLLPLARSRLVIDNEFLTDLEPELWKGDEVTEEIIAAGKRMGDLDLLPSPLPYLESPLPPPCRTASRRCRLARPCPPPPRMSTSEAVDPGCGKACALRTKAAALRSVWPKTLGMDPCNSGGARAT
jgi:hypothetical protein